MLSRDDRNACQVLAWLYLHKTANARRARGGTKAANPSTERLFARQPVNRISPYRSHDEASPIPACASAEHGAGHAGKAKSLYKLIRKSWLLVPYGCGAIPKVE